MGFDLVSVIYKTFSKIFTLSASLKNFCSALSTFQEIDWNLRLKGSQRIWKDLTAQFMAFKVHCWSNFKGSLLFTTNYAIKPDRIRFFKYSQKYFNSLLTTMHKLKERKRKFNLCYNCSWIFFLISHTSELIKYSIFIYPGKAQFSLWGIKIKRRMYEKIGLFL